MRKKLPTIVACVMFAQVAFGQADNACFEQAAKVPSVSIAHPAKRFPVSR